VLRAQMPNGARDAAIQRRILITPPPKHIGIRRAGPKPGPRCVVRKGTKAGLCVDGPSTRLSAPRPWWHGYCHFDRSRYTTNPGASRASTPDVLVEERMHRNGLCYIVLRELTGMR